MGRLSQNELPPAYPEGVRTPRRYDTDDGPRWRVRYRLGGVETSETFRVERDAKDFARILGDGTGTNIADALAWLESRRSSAEVLTFAQWFDLYRAQLTGITPRTHADYESIHQRYLTRFDQMPLTFITKAHVATLVNDLDGRGLSAKTIKNAVYLLSSVLGEAAEEGHITRSPVRKIKLPKPEAHDDLVHFLTFDEAGALVDAVPKDYQAFVTFLLGSGLRWAEATALQGRHVNLDAGTVLVRQAWKRIPGGQELGPPKSQKARRTVNASTLGLLAVSSVMRGPEDFVFVTSTGKPLRHGNFYNRIWVPSCVRAGLEPRPRIHDTRHTFASWLISEGATIEQVQDQLGHESYETTRKIYAHLLPAVGVEAGRLASAAMERALGDRVQFTPRALGEAASGPDQADDA
jgi:integrase